MKVIFCILLLAGSYNASAQRTGQGYEFSLATAHPNAKALMKDDFFWSPIDESAPFGSDDGWEAAQGFHDWRNTHSAASPVEYLKGLIGSFGYLPFPWDEMDTEKIKRYITISLNIDEAQVQQQVQMLKQQNQNFPTSSGKQLSDEELRKIVLASGKNMGLTYLINTDEAIIGTTFAQFVLEGKVDPQMKYFAGKALQRETLPLLIRQFGKADQQAAHNAKMHKLLYVVQKMPTANVNSGR